MKRPPPASRGHGNEAHPRGGDRRLALAGTATAEPTRTVAVGKVHGTEAYLAVTYDGHHLRAHACDGSARRLPTISAWFEAPWDGRRAITVAVGGHTLAMDGPGGGRLVGGPRRCRVVMVTGSSGQVQYVTVY